MRDWIWPDFPARLQPTTLDSAERRPDMLARIGDSSQESFPVVDKAGNLTGILSFDDVREALGQPDPQRMLFARDLADPNVVKLEDTEPLNLALRKFVDSERGELPVVDADDEAKIVGMLNRHDLILAYNRQMQQCLKD